MATTESIGSVGGPGHVHRVLAEVDRAVGRRRRSRSGRGSSGASATSSIFQPSATFGRGGPAAGDSGARVSSSDQDEGRERGAWRSILVRRDKGGRSSRSIRWGGRHRGGQSNRRAGMAQSKPAAGRSKPTSPDSRTPARPSTTARPDPNGGVPPATSPSAQRRRPRIASGSRSVGKRKRNDRQLFADRLPTEPTRTSKASAASSQPYRGSVSFQKGVLGCRRGPGRRSARRPRRRGRRRREPRGTPPARPRRRPARAARACCRANPRSSRASRRDEGRSCLPLPIQGDLRSQSWNACHFIVVQCGSSSL